MPWWAWVLLAPVGYFVAMCLLFQVIAWRSIPTLSKPVTFFGRERQVRIHELHGLPKFLRAWGTSMFPNVYLRGVLWPEGKPWDKEKDPPTIQAWMMADELDNCRQAIQWGWLIYRLRAFFEPLIWWKHDSRPMEREGVGRRNGITIGTDPDTSAPWLAEYSNAQMPNT